MRIAHLKFDTSTNATIDVNDAIEINVFLPSVNARVKVSVNTDVQHEHSQGMPHTYESEYTSVLLNRTLYDTKNPR